jgi:BirA family biotin operon repressor/biotin-[acetyl-CoA-carboxylase] ligase
MDIFVFNPIERTRPIDTQSPSVAAVSERLMGRPGVPGTVTPRVSDITDQLKSMPDPQGRIDAIEVQSSVGSTNEWALEDGRVGLLVVALEQTRGRGRHGNTWASPPGGIYITYAPPPETIPSRATDLSLIASLAVADCVEGALASAGVEEPRALLKWPNDVMVGDGKVAGVLVQSRNPPLAVVGIGLNVNTPIAMGPESQGEDWAIGPLSLREVAGRDLDLLEVMEDLVGHLVGRLEVGLDGKALEEYRSRCHTLGKRVSFTEDGVRTVGTAVDLDPDGGGLLVRLEDGQVRHVRSGEVHHVRSERG